MVEWNVFGSTSFIGHGTIKTHKRYLLTIMYLCDANVIYISYYSLQCHMILLKTFNTSLLNKKRKYFYKRFIF